MKKVAFITLGCKVNQYETNAMMQQYIEEGYEIVEHTQKADIYVVNTCTVTNMSDRKSRQMLRRVKALNQDAVVVACGCYAQVAKGEIEKIEEIDLVLGNNEKKNIVEYVEQYMQDDEIEITMDDIMCQTNFLDLGQVTYTEKNRAVIKVQDGCDRFCTYCIIPFARGRVRSRLPESIIKEVEMITKKGIQEIVITGIHVASYGKDFKNNYLLIDLLEDLNQIKDLKRIRLSSIEPLLITEEFVQRLVKLDKVCEHFHLSLQSGCNETLKRMNRRYTTEQFRDITTILRKHYENAILTTDIIVGFPGETKEEFETTYTFLKEIDFYHMHVFKYSPRKGTRAAKMEGQIDGKIKEERSQRLISLSEKCQERYHQLYIGKEVEVLYEEEKNGIWQGHAKNYILAKRKTSENLENMIVSGMCVGAEKSAIIVE